MCITSFVVLTNRQIFCDDRVMEFIRTSLLTYAMTSWMHGSRPSSVRLLMFQVKSVTLNPKNIKAFTESVYNDNFTLTPLGQF